MEQLKLYLDEDVHNLVAEALRLRGWEVETTIEAGNQRASDADQIQYASRRGYCIVTYNVTDFPRLHSEILAGGGHHAGIIVGTQDRPSVNAKTLLKLLGTFTSDDFVDQLLYLNNWMDD